MIPTTVTERKTEITGDSISTIRGRNGVHMAVLTETLEDPIRTMDLSILDMTKGEIRIDTIMKRGDTLFRTGLDKLVVQSIGANMGEVTELADIIRGEEVTAIVIGALTNITSMDSMTVIEDIIMNCLDLAELEDMYHILLLDLVSNISFL